MSTRSNIAIEDEKGKIHAIYVHSDGYPNGVGHCLLENYNSFISTLNKEKPSGIKGDFIISAFLTSTMGVSYKVKAK